MTTHLPVPVPFLDLAALHAPLLEDLDKVWFETLRDSSFIGGAEVAAFEREWSAYCGTTHALGVANGTDAIELVLAGLGVGPGDEVIVPANTFVATAEAVVTAGATPVFVDVDDATLLMTSDLIEPALTDRTKAVIVVHLYGAIPVMGPIQQLCDERGLWLVEDAAQAHGARHDDNRAGTFGVAATFSFYPGKNLGALGDAGAIVTNDDELAASMAVLANHGRGNHHLHVASGRNSRMDGLQAAALRLKLRRLDDWNSVRRSAHDQYVERFAGSPVQMLEVPASTQAVHHLEVIRTDHRDAVTVALGEAGIGWGIHYAHPCHRQPAFESFTRAPVPTAESAARRQLSIPMHPTLREHEIDRVVEVVLSAIAAAQDR